MAVTLEGYDERIETLTAQLPQPGLWQITNPGPNNQDGALICILSFIAQGQIQHRKTGRRLTQFMDEPLKVRIVDIAGQPLPDYHDQRYLPKVKVEIVPPSGITETVTMTATRRTSLTGCCGRSKAACTP